MQADRHRQPAARRAAAQRPAARRAAAVRLVAMLQRIPGRWQHCAVRIKLRGAIRPQRHERLIAAQQVILVVRPVNIEPPCGPG